MAIAYSLVAPKNGVIVIDRTRSADPINYTFALKIQNQGTTMVYYKLTETSGAWSITSPTDGKLGSVSSGSTATKTIGLQRALPTSDIVEPIDFTLEAYSDSEYSNLIESVSFSLTAILADIHSWPSYAKYDFDDGTEQGWTLSGGALVSNDKSITAGGYSIKMGGSGNYSMSRSITVPNTSRAVLVFYVNVHLGRLDTLSIKVNDTKVFVGGNSYDFIPSSTTTWDIIGVDLSDYAGQTVVLQISFEISNTIYIDDIIVAGTNAL